MNTLMLKICLKLGTGEMLIELIIFHGLKINTFLYIVEVAGLKEQPVLLPTESTSLEIELGLISLYHLKLSLTVKQEVAVMEAIQEVFMLMPKQMVFLNRVVKIIWLKILINSHALLFKDAKTALTLKVKSQETKATVGLLLATQFGK